MRSWVSSGTSARGSAYEHHEAPRAERAPTGAHELGADDSSVRTASVHEVVARSGRFTRANP